MRTPQLLFCGDTCSNAGAGNCHNGGHPTSLYNTLSPSSPKRGAEGTLIYPGHDYIGAIQLHPRPPSGNAREEMLPQMEKQETAKALVHHLGAGTGINTFPFRLTSPSVIKRLRDAFPDLPDNPTLRQCSAAPRTPQYV